MHVRSTIWTAGILGAALTVAFALFLGSQLRHPVANASAPASIAMEAFGIVPADAASARAPTALTSDGF